MYKLFKISGNTENFPQFEHFHNLSKEFLPFAQKRLGFDKPVSVNLLSDPENAKNPLGKTAYYEPGKMKITLFVDKRHVKDILRSMAHELVHHAQNCRGEFKNGFKTGEGYAQEDGHMREMEREAYEKGQMMLRDFEDGRKKKEKSKMLEEEVAYILKKRKGVSEAACRALNNPKNIKRRKLLPDRGVAEIGGSLKQSVNVKSFEHAYQMAQCHGADTFRYRGYKGKKFVNDEFKTDLYEIDPTRGLPDEHFDQMQKAYDRARRNLEESTLKENKKMSRLNEKKMPMKKDTEDVDGDGQTDDQVPAFLDKGDVKKKKKTGKQPPQLAKAQGKDVDSEEEETNEGKGKKCKKCEKARGTDEGQCPGPNEAHCPGKRDDKKLEEKAGEKRTRWVIDGDIVHCRDGCTKKDAERRVKKAQDARAKGDERRARAKEKTNEGWTKKKDQLLFERLVKKWAK